jgi:hypothetical protein
MLVIGECDEFEQGDLMLIKFDVERSCFFFLKKKNPYLIISKGIVPRDLKSNL